jgi:hypothetical protein
LRSACRLLRRMSFGFAEIILHCRYEVTLFTDTFSYNIVSNAAIR